jgi:hypothetical protein
MFTGLRFADPIWNGTARLSRRTGQRSHSSISGLCFHVTFRSLLSESSETTPEGHGASHDDILKSLHHESLQETARIRPAMRFDRLPGSRDAFRLLNYAHRSERPGKYLHLEGGSHGRSPIRACSHAAHNPLPRPHCEGR